MLVNIENTEEFYTQLTEHLRKGRILALPTDTVYGFAADGLNMNARQKLSLTKERGGKPFTYFVSRTRLENYAYITKRKIVEYFVPGPITIILRSNPESPLYAQGKKIGIRIPQIDFIIKLLSKYDNPLAVTSANRPGEPPLESASEIAEQFPKINLVVDGGRLTSIPSSVIDLTTTPPVLLRKGRVQILEIERVYGKHILLQTPIIFNVLFVCSGNTCRSPMAQGILKTMVDQKYCDVRSAGTLSMNGLPASENSILVVEQYGGSIRRHRSQSLTRDLIDWADLILVMGYKHYEQVIDIQPEAAVKTFLLKEYKKKVKYNEISDPVGKDLKAYEAAAANMLSSLRLIARDIKRRFRKTEGSEE